MEWRRKTTLLVLASSHGCFSDYIDSCMLPVKTTPFSLGDLQVQGEQQEVHWSVRERLMTPSSFWCEISSS